MDLIQWFIDFILHLDRHLDEIVRSFGLWSYAILFLIIFCETGLVVTPILPGDSLLFAAGAIASLGTLEVEWLMLLLSAAAILGDTVNYWIGHLVGPRVFTSQRSRIFNQKHLERTRRFYAKHGGKTIIIARFMPIIRTFAPFVAGIGAMNYGRFILFNVVGGVAWIVAFVLGGYYFGNLPLVERHFTLVIVAIVLLSILPGMIIYLRERRRARRAAPGTAAPSRTRDL